MPQLFGQAGREWLRELELAPGALADISVKARRHAAGKPSAEFREPVTREEVLASPMVFDPLNKLQCCGPACGAAAAVLCSPDFLGRRGATGRPEVRLAGQAVTTDTESSFTGRADKLVGSDLTARAADRLYTATGVDPSHLDVVELHDCFTINEALSYEGLRLCTAERLPAFMVGAGATYGGQVVVNPSGGLLAKGHPLGATGIALAPNLSGSCPARRARDGSKTRLALQHNIGLGGICAVGLYERVT